MAVAVNILNLVNEWSSRFKSYYDITYHPLYPTKRNALYSAIEGNTRSSYQMLRIVQVIFSVPAERNLFNINTAHLQIFCQSIMLVVRKVRLDQNY